MQQASHKAVTQKAFDLLKGVNSTLPLLAQRDIVAQEAYNTDDYNDLEFVDVEGGIGDGGRDDPHSDEFFAIDDEPHYSEQGNPLTTYNHFIDIKKGPGIFDDFDGYSYQKGSAKNDQFQDAKDATDDTLAKIVATLTGQKVDEGLAYWFNDEYVHAPGQSWYRGCSPAVERYSFPQDKGVYPNTTAEAKARFPLAESTGSSGKGIPYSVFMPVDNLARYWYGQYMSTKVAKNLGPVMHAIHDASIPHHAAGYSGNWHGRYEKDLGNLINPLLSDPSFANSVNTLFTQWYKDDPNPPAKLAVNDYTRTPARNWRIDMLVTWVALNAYKDYAGVYNHFKNGYKFDNNSARNLTILATAMSMMVLAVAAGYKPQWSAWSSLSGGVKEIASACNRDGRLEVFAIGTDNALWHIWQTVPCASPWSAWSSRGGGVRKITAICNRDGRLEVFAIGTDNALWHIWQTAPGAGSWSTWTSLSGGIKDLSVTSNRDGRLEVFAIGTNNALWHISQTAPSGGSWTSWASLGGGIKAVSAICNRDGRLETFAIGTDNALWHIWQTTPGGSWSGWASRGGGVKAISAACNGDGRLEVFAIGTDNALWHIWQTVPSVGPWSNWTSRGGGVKAISPVSNKDGRLEVFAIGTDNALWHIWQTVPSGGPWSNWASLGGGIKAISAICNRDGRLEPFAIGTDNALWHIWQV